VLLASAGLALLACAGEALPAPPQARPPEVAGSTPVVLPRPPATGTTTRFSLDPERSEARYRAREQLAQVSLPSDAVGTTKGISGTIALLPDGTVARDSSRITVELGKLRSDDNRRDNFLQRTTLETGRFPTAEFTPTEIRGLPFPIPASGEARLQIVGDLAVRDTTRTATWEVEAQFSQDEIAGRASTAVTFADLGLTKPRVFLVLSIDDVLKLELDFVFRSSPPLG